jgi:hypothetical protein
MFVVQCCQQNPLTLWRSVSLSDVPDRICATLTWHVSPLSQWRAWWCERSVMWRVRSGCQWRAHVLTSSASYDHYFMHVYWEMWYFEAVQTQWSAWRCRRSAEVPVEGSLRRRRIWATWPLACETCKNGTTTTLRFYMSLWKSSRELGKINDTRAFSNKWRHVSVACETHKNNIKWLIVWYHCVSTLCRERYLLQLGRQAYLSQPSKDTFKFQKHNTVIIIMSFPIWYRLTTCG